MSEIVGPIDQHTCAACKADIGSTGPQEELLSRLPHEGCTCANGCRCGVEILSNYTKKKNRPTPSAYLYQWPGGFGQKDVVSIEKWDDEAIGGGWKETPLYTADNLRAYANLLMEQLEPARATINKMRCM